MIAEAIDAAVTVGWALLAWIVLTAVVATAALYAVVAVAWWVGRGLWRAARALMPRARRCVPISRPQCPPCGSRLAGAPVEPPDGRTAPRVPSWAHQQPIDYEEAA